MTVEVAIGALFLVAAAALLFRALTAAPGVPGEPPLTGIPAEIVQSLSALQVDEAVRPQSEWRIQGKAVFCLGEKQVNGSPKAVLLCQWGNAVNVMFEGRSIFWHDGSRWLMQEYPSEYVRGVGYFEQLYLTGDRLIAVMNVAGGMTMSTQQVQVLRYDHDRWMPFWAPREDEWTRGHARVTFSGEDYSSFQVDTTSYLLPQSELDPFVETNAGEHRQFVETWNIEDDTYVMISRVELPTEYGAVFHFVRALTMGDEDEASRWAIDRALVDRVKRLGLTQMESIRWMARREGSTVSGWGPAGPTFRLVAVGTESPQWTIKVTKRGDQWLVSEVP